MSAILIFVNINNAYANEFLNTSLINPNDTIILGSTKEIVDTTNDIGKYLAYNISVKQTEDNIIQKENFVSKPLVLETNSRQEIEKEKTRKEEEKTRALAYNYSYPSYTNDYSRNTITRETEDRNISNSNPNSYYYGYCTWYVASKKDVPGLWGNAGQWLNSAQNSGYETSNSAKEDSIIVTNESGWGHVGVVESVNEDTVTISEMNYNGWGVVNTREIPKNSPVIEGFIY